MAIRNPITRSLILATALAGAAGAAMAQRVDPLPVGENSRAMVRNEAVVHNRNPANTNTPNGEASTTRNHQPNATPQVSMNTRQEVRQETYKVKPRFGDTVGERPDVPTNQVLPAGTPK